MGGIDADDFRSRSPECLFMKLRSFRERLYRFSFRRMDGKYAEQVRDLENLQKDWRHLAELEIAALGPQPAELTNQGSQSDTVEETDFFQLQNNFLGQLRQFFQFELKRADFSADNNAALAPNDGDVVYPLILQAQLH